MRAERPPSFRGRLYPEDPEALLAAPTAAAAWSGSARSRLALVPHGSLEACADLHGAARAHLEPTVSRVVLLGPLHAPASGPDPSKGERLDGVVADPRGRWRGPVGPHPLIPVQAVLGDAQGPGRTSADLHDREHSLEGALAGMGARARGWEILPLLVDPGTSPEVLRRLSACLARWLAADPSHALVATTDLDHYHEPASGRRRHARMLDVLARGDPQALEAGYRAGEMAPCGALPAVVFLQCARQLGWTTKVLVYGWWGPEAGRLGGLAAVASPDEKGP